jgi:hypothetical protein
VYTVWRVALVCYYYHYDGRAAVLRAEWEAQAVAYEAKARERQAKEQRELIELENKRRAVEQVHTNDIIYSYWQCLHAQLQCLYAYMCRALDCSYTYSMQKAHSLVLYSASLQSLHVVSARL